MSGRTQCPRCGVRPSRLRMVYRGVVPLCVECWQAGREASWARWRARRNAALPMPPPVPAPQRFQPWGEGEPLQDISAAEIERRFAAAKAAIRRRA